MRAAEPERAPAARPHQAHGEIDGEIDDQDEDQPPVVGEAAVEVAEQEQHGEGADELANGRAELREAGQVRRALVVGVPRSLLVGIPKRLVQRMHSVRVDQPRIRSRSAHRKTSRGIAARILVVQAFGGACCGSH